MSVRSAAQSDLSGILEVERLSFTNRKQWGQGDFQDSMKDLFLVFEDGKISGFLIASCWKDTGRAVILRIAVHPDHRNRGIATRLIEAAIERFRKMGLREVEIDVEIVKRGAIQLYEKVGFRTVRGIPMSENDSMDDEDGSFFLMKLPLRE